MGWGGVGMGWGGVGWDGVVSGVLGWGAGWVSRVVCRGELSWHVYEVGWAGLVAVSVDGAEGLATGVG